MSYRLFTLVGASLAAVFLIAASTAFAEAPARGHGGSDGNGAVWPRSAELGTTSAAIGITRERIAWLDDRDGGRAPDFGTAGQAGRALQ